MPRAATNSDVFNAVAEPRRRAILDLLAEGERSVNDMVEGLPMDQPSVSKHLRILRDVGLVSVRRDGRQRLYRIDAAQLKLVHDWAKTFERYWDSQLGSIKSLAESTHQKRKRQRKSR